jgi:hypothetical protein
MVAGFLLVEVYVTLYVDNESERFVNRAVFVLGNILIFA